MNNLTTEKRVQVISALVEGNSIRSTVRMTGVAKNTVSKLLVDVGTACSAYQDDVMKNLPCKKIQVDEIWSFVGKKEKNAPEIQKGLNVVGDAWTWVAICADTKLVPSWLVGQRDTEYAETFMRDVASRLRNRVQLTSDGLKSYLNAVEEAFGGDIDCSMLIKQYGNVPTTANNRYTSGECTGSKKEPVVGNIAVGTAIADRPPHRSVRAELPHTALTLDTDERIARWDRDAGFSA